MRALNNDRTFNEPRSNPSWIFIVFFRIKRLQLSFDLQEIHELNLRNY